MNDVYGYPLGQNWGMESYATPALSVPSPVQPAQPASDWSWFNQTDANGVKTQGMAPVALGAAQGIFNAWLGMKQYGLAKQSLAESKAQFGLNYDAQRTTTNAQLQDRQRARVASNPGAYQSVGDYMSTYGIQPRG